MSTLNTTVTLDKRHFKAAARRAQEVGTTPRQYIHSLIDAANLTFDEILRPVREGFRKSGVTEVELDKAVSEARKAIRAKSRREKRR